MILPDPPRMENAAAQESASPAGRSPGHVLLGYWHNWQSQAAAFIPLRDIPHQYDVIHIAFAASDPARPGRMLFTPCGEAEPGRFKSTVRALRDLGKQVVLSIGGANGSPALVDEAAGQDFVDSVTQLVEEYGFDGIDVNLEGKVVLDPGDTDLLHPRSPSIVRLVEAVREVRSRFGTGFILSLTPETVNVQGGHRAYRQAWGAYLPVIQGLRDSLTYVQVQHYNSAPMLALDGDAYSQGTADFLVALADMLLRGFSLPGEAGQAFDALKPEQVVVGLPASAEAARGGFTAASEVRKALEYLALGRSFGGRYVLGNGHRRPAPRGVMLWSINWDAAGGCLFSQSIRDCLDRLP
jgi:chitinase